MARTIGRGLTLTAVAGLLALPALGQERGAGYETPPVLKASDVLPSAWQKSEHHRVEENVANDCAMNLYRIDSDFGEYEVWGEVLARVRIREITAMAALAEVSDAQVAGEGVGRALTGSLEDTVAFLRSPGETLKALPHGVKLRFKSTKRDVEEGVAAVKGEKKTSDRSKSVGGHAESILGVDAAERRWAQNLRVDPYTANPRLKAALRRVARIDGYASLGTKLVKVPSLPGTDLVKNVYGVVWTLNPGEIRVLNEERLEGMGAPAETIAALFEVETLTPTTMTAIVGALAEMEGVADRRVVIEEALSIASEADALFLVESLLLAGHFHSTEAKLARFVPGTGVPVAVTADGRLVAFTAVDYSCWSREIAPLARSFSSAYEADWSKREVWISGGVSARFVAEVKRLGWACRSGFREELLPKLPWTAE